MRRVSRTSQKKKRYWKAVFYKGEEGVKSLFGEKEYIGRWQVSRNETESAERRQMLDLMKALSNSPRDLRTIV